MRTLPDCYQPPEFENPEILYSDDHLIVANKPSGLLSVPGRGENKKDCLIARIQLSSPEALVVHRLDMQTSGLMVLARNKDIQTSLSRLFEQRNINKEYVAIVDGEIQQSQGKIDLPLITDWPNRPRQKVDFESGKSSITQYEVIAYDSNNNSTRVKLKPVTGRSHQLRVHLLSIGHVIYGDALYADEYIAGKSERLLLHANRITFNHPITQSVLDIESKVPF